MSASGSGEIFGRFTDCSTKSSFAFSCACSLDLFRFNLAPEISSKGCEISADFSESSISEVSSIWDFSSILVSDEELSRVGEDVQRRLAVSSSFTDSSTHLRLTDERLEELVSLTLQNKIVSNQC